MSSKQKPITITSKDITTMANKLKRLGPTYARIVEMEIAATAVDIERMASQWAPIDKGFLRNSIKASKMASSTWKVSAQVFYAAYMEFGTGTMVEIPRGMEEYAKDFMAPRPVKMEVNIPARPFFFPAYRQGIKALQGRLADELKRATQK